jgi:hypothetical protein
MVAAVGGDDGGQEVEKGENGEVDHGGCLGYGSNLGMSVLRWAAVGSSA